MLLKRALFSGALFIIPFLLSAQEKVSVAVLDTVLLDGSIPRNASPVMAAYLNDSFAASSRYAPLDRSLLYTSWYGSSPGDVNIVSLVQRGDYSRLGELLGADFLCLSTLQKDGGGYLLKAELFDTSDGGVTARETARSDRLAGLPDAARQAGINLSGASPSALPQAAPPLVAAQPKQQPGEEAPAEADSAAGNPPPPPQEDQPEKTSVGTKDAPRSGKPGPFGSMTLSFLLPGFVGNEDFHVNSVNTPLYSRQLGEEEFNWGMDFNLRITGTSFFCFDLGFTIASQLLTNKDLYGSDETAMNFGFFDFYLGLGGVLPLSDKFQLAAVGTLGYAVLMLGSEAWDYPIREAYDESSGVTLGIGAGIDFKPFGDFVLTLRYKYSYASELDLMASDFGYQGVMIGFGSAF